VEESKWVEEDRHKLTRKRKKDEHVNVLVCFLRTSVVNHKQNRKE